MDRDLPSGWIAPYNDVVNQRFDFIKEVDNVGLGWGEGGEGGGVLLPTAYTGRLRLKGVPFVGFRYMKG